MGEGGEAGVAHVVVQGVVSDQAGVVVLRPCEKMTGIMLDFFQNWHEIYRVGHGNQSDTRLSVLLSELC